MAIENLKNQVQNIINLPPLPNITMEIIGMIDNPNINVQTLSKAIAKDQVITSKVLKVANSPFFSYPRIISTIDFAITILGYEAVKEIVLSASYIGHFKNYKNDQFNTESFWLHLTSSSVISREIAKSIKYPLVGEAFIAGLIHDMGIFIMSQFFQKEFNQLLELTSKEDKNLLDIENEIFGATHTEIGSWLLEKWNFPPQLVEAVKYHHTPEKASINPKLTTIIYYTEYLSQNLKIGNFQLEDKIITNFDNLKIIGIDNEQELIGIYENNKENFDKELDKTKLLL